MPTTPKSLAVQASIIRIVGVFEISSTSSGRTPSTAQRLANAGFLPEVIDQEKFDIMQNIFYPEFVNIMYACPETEPSPVFKGAAREGEARVLSRQVGLEAALGLKRPPPEPDRAPFTIDHAEVFLFPEPSLGVFAVDISAGDHATLGAVSDLTFGLRAFDAPIHVNDQPAVKLATFIQHRVLGGIPVGGETSAVDAYSGSKFKMFSVVDLAEPQTPDERRHLLFDLGCGVPLGSAEGFGFFAPATQYYDTLMGDLVSAFQNYDALPLLDSFTAVGHKLLPKQYANARDSWATSYFRLYVFNLFVKFSLHRYAADLSTESAVPLRAKFERFLRWYEVGRVSFNFLPEMLYDGMRKGLAVDDELARFRERIQRLSTNIQEAQAERANKLLGLVSALGTLSSAGAVIAFLREADTLLGWPPALFYSLLTALIVALGVSIAAYMFPDQRKKVISRWKKPRSR